MKNQAGLNVTRAYSEFPQWRGEPRRGSVCAEAEINDGGDERRRARVLIAGRMCSNRQMLKKKCKATLVVFTERRAEGVGRANR